MGRISKDDLRPSLTLQIENTTQDLETHKADIATDTELGHIKAKTEEDGTLILPKNLFFAPNFEGWFIPGWFAELSKNNVAFLEDRVYYVPIYISQDTAFSEIGITVDTGVGGTQAEIGIYSIDNGLPKDLLLDAGTVDTSTTGDKSIVIDISLDAGYYFTAIRAIGANISLRGIDTDNPYSPPVSGVGLALNQQPTRCILAVNNQTELLSLAPMPEFVLTPETNAVKFKI